VLSKIIDLSLVGSCSQGSGTWIYLFRCSKWELVWSRSHLSPSWGWLRDLISSIPVSYNADASFC